jgi:hypothetical protein
MLLYIASITASWARERRWHSKVANHVSVIFDNDPRNAQLQHCMIMMVRVSNCMMHLDRAPEKLRGNVRALRASASYLHVNANTCEHIHASIPGLRGRHKMNIGRHVVETRRRKDKRRSILVV